MRPVKDQLPSSKQSIITVMVLLITCCYSSAMKDVWNLNYGVKYYISDPSFLQEDVSRY